MDVMQSGMAALIGASLTTNTEYLRMFFISSHLVQVSEDKSVNILQFVCLFVRFLIGLDSSVYGDRCIHVKQCTQNCLTIALFIILDRLGITLALIIRSGGVHLYME